MNITYQKCNVCGAVNSSADTTWTRHFGSFAGAPNLVAQPSPFMPAAAAAQTTGVRPVVIDLCATCADTMTVSKLVALTTTLKA